MCVAATSYLPFADSDFNFCEKVENFTAKTPYYAFRNQSFYPQLRSTGFCLTNEQITPCSTSHRKNTSIPGLRSLSQPADYLILYTLRGTPRRNFCIILS